MSRPVVSTLTTPCGSPASSNSSNSRMEVMGVVLDAFITMVLPVAIHSGTIQPIGIMAGKLNGAIPANTPSGSR